MIEIPAIVGLASGSPRRRQLLESMGLDVHLLPAGIDESRQSNEPLADFVARLAIEKARFGVTAGLPMPMPVLGGDTIVVSDEEVFGKPRDEEDAVRMLLRLSGRAHIVLTSIAVLWGVQSQVRVVSSEIHFAALTEGDARDYWASGEPEGKAGAYAIQGLGARFVEHLNGSHSAVVGLPVHETWQMLRSMSEELNAGKKHHA
ncbi:MAG: nucleoside triphosphate pyrophosphatase [Woeseiaceae bacterium]